jgi:hypothetical protein
MSFFIDNQGKPYVAFEDWSDPTYTQKATVMKYGP